MFKKKPLIVFEGIEGSGKTTLIDHVAKNLKKKKLKFIKIREPGGNNNSELIRKLILNKNNKFNSFTDLMLYFAARNENIHKVIKKNYNKKIILMDRFTDSTLAYQHYGMGLDKNLIDKINKILLKKIKPRAVFVNVVSEKNLKKRLNLRKNKNRYDNFNINFYKKVQRGFLKLSKNRDNYFIIDSNKKLDENKNIVLNKVLKLIF
tara:strand:- start:1534 stop:2151 length:618 start_codon:yes stop_codon:yes gene_type:complete